MQTVPRSRVRRVTKDISAIMNLVDVRHRIAYLLALSSKEVETQNAMGQFDINTVAETVFVPILGIVFGYHHLRDLNLPRKSFPAVDLGDDDARIAIQVTATPTIDKVNETLRVFLKYDLEKRFDTVKIYILTARRESYPVATIRKVTRKRLKFDPKTDIIDARDLARLVRFMDLQRATDLLAYLEDGFGEVDGDSIGSLRQHFRDATNRNLRDDSPQISATRETLPRAELDQIRNLAKSGSPILLVGEPGAGKTGILTLLARDIERQKAGLVLFLDTRKLLYCRNVIDLGNSIALRGTIVDACRRLARLHSVFVIVDQFESALGQAVADILVDLAADCARIPNTFVVIASRLVTANESRILPSRLNKGFKIVPCELLDVSTTTRVLDKIGFKAPSDNLVQLARTPLNLELLGQIAEGIPFDPSSVTDDIDLWEAMCRSLEQRLGTASSPNWGRQVIVAAMELSRSGLSSHDGTFSLPAVTTREHETLQSERWIKMETRVIGRFMHERMQDYLYALYASERKMMPSQIANELPRFREIGVVPFLMAIYMRHDAALFAELLGEILS